MDKETKNEFENLAVMINKGFEETATKDELNALRVDMNDQFKGVNRRLDRIEDFILKKHDQHIERLEEEMREVRESLSLG